MDEIVTMDMNNLQPTTLTTTTSLSILTTIFPGGPVVASRGCVSILDFIGAKNDEDGGENWRSYYLVVFVRPVYSSGGHYLQVKPCFLVVLLDQSIPLEVTTYRLSHVS